MNKEKGIPRRKERTINQSNSDMAKIAAWHQTRKRRSWTVALTYKTVVQLEIIAQLTFFVMIIVYHHCFSDFCPYEISHGFLWNRTQVGRQVLKQCSLVDPAWTGDFLSKFL